MQPNPYSNEPDDMQPTEANPVPPDPQQPPPPPSYNPDALNVPPSRQDQRRAEQYQARAYEQQRRATTATYGVAKFMDYLRWVLAVLEVLFALRFLLKLLGADPANPFANFLYSLTGVFLYPFKGLVQDPTFGTTTFHVFEWTTLVGMAVYALFFWIIWLLLRTTISRPQEPIS